LKPGIQLAYAAARIAGLWRPRTRKTAPLPPRAAEPGISVIIPSRNGKELLAAQLPGILADLPGTSEVLVIDNGSDDGTAAWLRAAYPQVNVDVSPQPLSFARAANRGFDAARHARICLLNNDMLIDPGFFAALDHAFDAIPELFCATAQIRFPPGIRREETGKAVMAQSQPDDFPLRCDEPIPGEDLTYVLYGSGGCSLYDASLLRALGGIDTVYKPAYVEDLDIGFRAWQHGWPSVYVAGARVEHRHRATTSRYYTPQQLASILEINYLQFLARSVSSQVVFRRLWSQALERLCRRAPHDSAAREALRQAAAIARRGGPAMNSRTSEELILALTNGTVFVFPGHKPTGNPRHLATVPAGRPADRDSILIRFADKPATPESKELMSHIEIVEVQRGPSAELSFRAALRQTLRKWRPDSVELGADFVSYTAEISSKSLNLK
jgi:GT2 family glycosyltransferase